MNYLKSKLNAPLTLQILLGLYLFIYLTSGIYTELKLITLKPLPEDLFQDYRIYERAVNDALKGNNPYEIQKIGSGFLYAPPALLIIDFFQLIKDPDIRKAVFITINFAFIIVIAYGIAKYYGLKTQKIWYWYILCLGFAPFLELIHIGQINVITMFGIFLMFVLVQKSPYFSGLGLGMAIISKITPVFFMGYLLVNRKFKIILTTFVVIALLTGLAILRYGLTPILEYPKTFLWLMNQFHLTINSQSLVAKLAIANTVQFERAITLVPELIKPPIIGLFTFFTNQYILIQRILTIYIMLVIAISCILTYIKKLPGEPLFIVTALGMMISPNIAWYHHYVFILLPLLIWMGWRGLNWKVVSWCLIGLLIVQLDRRLLTSGLLIHIFSHTSIIILLYWQARQFFIARTVATPAE
jgi:hypothetical protein